MSSGTTKLTESQASTSELHSPKIETFDISALTNTDPKGFIRQVDEYRIIGETLLYMRRGMDHAKFGYIESFLLADEGIRLSIYHFRPNAKLEHIRYIDIVDIEKICPQVWQTRDLYLDILAIGTQVDDYPNNHKIIVDDTDELVEAIATGLVSPETGRKAMETAFAAISGISAHDGDIEQWLLSLGYAIDWADNVELAEPQGTK